MATKRAAAPRRRSLFVPVATAERIAGFCDRIAANRRDREAIRGTCEQERSYLRSARFLLPGDDPDAEPRTLSLARRRRLIQLYRSALRERFGEEHLSLKYMVLSDKEQEAYNERTKANVRERHVSRRPLKVDQHIATARAILEAAASGGSLPALEIAAALIGVTGRRPIEILQTGDFASVKNPDPALFDGSVPPKYRWTLMFSGQAKREKEGYDTPPAPPYEIPVLVEPDLILRVFKALRKRYDCSGLTPQQVGNRAWKELGKYAKARYQDDRPLADKREREAAGITPSSLRAAYATCAYELYAPMRFSWNAYTARILGHLPTDYTTSLSYDQFYPIGSKRDYARDIRTSTRETLDALRAAREREADPKNAAYLDDKIATVQARLDELS
jgi:hypothetical protein